MNIDRLSFIKKIAGAVSFGASIFWLPFSQAQTAVFELSAITSSTIASGDSVEVQVRLIIDSPALGNSFLFSEATSAGFAIGNVVDSRVDTPWSDFSFTDSEVVEVPFNELAPANSRDLGGINPGLTPQPADAYVLGVFRIDSAGVAPGNYTLGLSLLDVFDENFSTFLDISSNSLGINVVPEPSTGLLVAVGFLFLGSRRGGSSLERTKNKKMDCS